MDRAEGTGLGAAVIGHVVLFGLLSVGFLATPNPVSFESTPLDVSLVDEIALESAAPQSAEPPAQSLAPEIGPVEDAPPPAETVAEPEPTPPVPQPKPAPTPPPKATPTPKPDPRKAAPREAPKAQPKATPPATRSTGTARTTTATRPRGSRLGDDFLKGIVDTPSQGKAVTPRAQNVSATAVASIGDAIRRQVQPCANRVTNPGPGANQITSKLRLQMNRDGTMAVRPELRGQTGVSSENERYARRVAELAASAIIACAPYELPAELYEGGWKDIIINYKLPD